MQSGERLGPDWAPDWARKNGMHARKSLLTNEDIVYLDKLKAWLRSSLEFAVLRKTPSEGDLVFLRCELPFFLRGQSSDKFVTLGELVKICEDSASNQMIYEAWVNSALDNAYSAARALSGDDGDRFISYFKAYHDIDDEGALADEAHEAIEDARRVLYGEMEDYV